MKLGVDAMPLDPYRDKLAHRLLQRKHCKLRQGATEDLPKFLMMAIHDGGNESLFAGKVLVERADTHTRLFGDTVGAGSEETNACSTSVAAGARY
jgi:hypothetical protein